MGKRRRPLPDEDDGRTRDKARCKTGKAAPFPSPSGGSGEVVAVLLQEAPKAVLR